MFRGGIQKMIHFFGEATEVWARQVQAMLDVSGAGVCTTLDVDETRVLGELKRG